MFTHLNLDHVADAIYNEQVALTARAFAEEANIACCPKEVLLVGWREKSIARRVNVPAHETRRGNLDLAHLLQCFNLTAVVVFQSDANSRKQNPTRTREDFARRRQGPNTAGFGKT